MSRAFLNLDQAAEYLHLERSALEELVKREEIPFERRGKRIVFDPARLDAWASQRILGLRASSLEEYHRTSSSRVREILAGQALMPRLLNPERIRTALKSRTKPSVLRDMVALADETGLVSDPRDLLAGLEAREQLCSTAMEGGVALLHPQHLAPHMFTDSFTVLGRTIHPVHAGAPDGKPTDIFFLICCQDDRLHLHLLARICAMCQNTELLYKLRRAGDAAEMYEILIACEQQVLDQH